MCCKALMFEPEKIEKILKLNVPAKIKNEGRKIKNFEEYKWSETRLLFVTMGNFLKFN